MKSKAKISEYSLTNPLDQTPRCCVILYINILLAHIIPSAPLITTATSINHPAYNSSSLHVHIPALLCQVPYLLTVVCFIALFYLATCSEHYEFCVMPFWLCNGPSTFQQLIESVFVGLSRSHCMVYLDDMMVIGRNFMEHLENFWEVFERLHQAASLKLKAVV